MNCAKLRLFCLLIVICISILDIVPSEATPIYLEFSGEVTKAQYTPFCVDGDCFPAFEVGQSVVFTAMVDFAVDPLASTVVLPPEPNFWDIDYYHAEYLSGPSFVARDADQFNNAFGYGTDSPSGWMVGVYSALFAPVDRGADFGDAPFKIYSAEKMVAEWELGDTILGSEHGRLFQIEYKLKLSSKSDTNPVPEPATIIMLGAGFIGLTRWRRWKHKVGGF